MAAETTPEKNVETSTDKPGAWEPIVAERFESWHVSALLDQKAPCVVIPNFLQPEWREEIASRFGAFADAHPDHRIRLRPTATVDVLLDAVAFPLDLFAHTKPLNLDPYFAGVARDRAALRALYQGGPDPLELIRAYWREIGWTELPAMEGDKPYQTDVLWGLVGKYSGEPHVDTVHRDLGLSLSHYTNRLNFNAFVQCPTEGGNFRFYRRYRATEDFTPDTLKGVESVVCTAREGDLVIHDASSYYEILSMDGPRRRLAVYLAAGIDSHARELSLFV